MQSVTTFATNDFPVKWGVGTRLKDSAYVTNPKIRFDLDRDSDNFLAIQLYCSVDAVGNQFIFAALPNLVSVTSFLPGVAS